MNLPRATVQNLSSKRVLALIRGVNALKKSGILDLLKTENPMDALLSGAIKPEQVFPVVAAFAPLLHGDLPSSSATPQPSSPSAVPQEKAVEKLRSYVRDDARTKTVLKDLKNYFDLTDAQLNSYFGV